MKRSFEYFEQNLWVWAGTALALITLSGFTRKLGVIIAIVALVLHAIASYMPKDES